MIQDLTREDLLALVPARYLAGGPAELGAAAPSTDPTSTCPRQRPRSSSPPTSPMRRR